MKKSVLLLASMALAMLMVSGAVLVGLEPAEAAFPGKNGKIAFISNRDGNDEVYTMNADGSGQRNLTNNSAPDSSPAFSPDGTKIAFASDRGGRDDIYIMNADGSEPRNLTNNSAYDYQPSFSPDGTKIVYGSEGEINIMNADGSGQRNITDHSAYDVAGAYTPSFSPDGTTIVYASYLDDHYYSDINIMNTDGSGQRNLTNTRLTDDRDPSYSPDGTKIVFASDRDNGESGKYGDFDIYIMNADGSGLMRLTKTPGNAITPSFSPDGTKIAYTSDGAIYAMNTDGSGQQNLTSPYGGTSPDWQPLPSSPSSKAECKNGGYKDFGFKNQGRCIKAVNHAD